MPSTTTTSPRSLGQVIEYIQDRLYLASYTQAPDASTPFPYARSARSPGKRSSRAAQGPTTAQRAKALPPAYFTLNKLITYNAFHADFGPLHIGHLWRFAVQLHDVLGDPENQDRPVVFWTKTDSRSRANTACILACYMVLIQEWPPHLALAPIAQMDPPPMPFRDAGYSQADYVLTVQDVVYGVWKAKTEGLCALKSFSLEEYEEFERVDKGDFNWLTPNFLAFASPQHAPTHLIPKSSPTYSTLPTTIQEVEMSAFPTPLKNVLAHFSDRNVGLVVRLNSELYSASYFTAMGIQHLDMIFEDGTCPTLGMVRTFITLAHEVITVRKKSIAVHCKAGLGRTGCLIGAYLIYRYAFTANEIIAYMRFMRPGMVVGPQQHWLHLNQSTFREWFFEDAMRAKVAEARPATPRSYKQRRVSYGQTCTPPGGSSKRAALGEIASNEQQSAPTPIGMLDDNLPAPTPGQPRKTSRLHGQAAKRRSSHRAHENEPFARPDAEAMATHRIVRGESESEEEYQLRLLARRNASRTPRSNEKRRAISCTTTTTTTTTAWAAPGADSDIENRGARDGSPTRGKSHGSGKGEIAVGKTRASPSRRSTDSKSGVRKTSGRVGSLGAAASPLRPRAS